MSKRYNPYIKQGIELAEESKNQLVISRELIESIHDNRELGIKIREMYQQKVRDCDEYIKHMKSINNP